MSQHSTNNTVQQAGGKCYVQFYWFSSQYHKLIIILTSCHIIITKNLTQFTAVCKNFPAATCATGANLVCSVTHIFSKQMRPLEQIVH